MIRGDSQAGMFLRCMLVLGHVHYTGQPIDIALSQYILYQCILMPVKYCEDLLAS